MSLTAPESHREAADERRELDVKDLAPHHPFKDTVRRLRPYESDLSSSDQGILDSDAILRDAVRRMNLDLTDAHSNTPIVSVPYVVLSADIRKSTFLMKEAEDLAEYARVMTGFITSSRRTVGEYGGWFDKFMGDGFLAYWPCFLYSSPATGRSLAADHLHACLTLEMLGSLRDIDVSRPVTAQQCLSFGLYASLSAASLLVKVFESTHKPAFRQGSRNFRADTGLTVGLDIGVVQIVPIGQEITVVGHPVVGAVRMTSAGNASQIIANARVGDFVHRTNTGGIAHAALNRRFNFTPTIVNTKEYEQEAYIVEGRG